MEKRLTALENLASRSEERFDRVDVRLDRIEGRLDRIEVRMDGIEVRMDGIEVRMDGIEKRMDIFEVRLDQTATKADLAELRTEMHKGFADVIKWVVGMAIVLGASGITVMTFVLNNAVPKAPMANPLPQPIIIQLPAMGAQPTNPAAPTPP